MTKTEVREGRKDRSTRRRVAAAAALAACLCSGLDAPAAAHPHIWVDVRVEVAFDEAGAVTGLRQTWLFDELYTAYATEGMDADGDGVPDQDQLDALLAENIGNLEEFDYFTLVERDDGGKVAFGPIGGLASQILRRDDLNYLQMSFELPFAEPVAVGERFVYSVFDPTYYIDMLHAEADDAIRLVDRPPGCSFEVIKPDPDPASVELAASLDAMATAPNTLGAVFAEKVVIRCAP